MTARTLRLSVACWALVLGACSTVQKVPVEPKLGEPEDPVKPLVSGVKVAVLRFVPPPPPPPPAPVKESVDWPRSVGGVCPMVAPADGAAGDAPVSTGPASAPVPKGPPPLPTTVVDFTSKYAEAYPSLAHAMAAIPAALREQGFEVICP